MNYIVRVSDIGWEWLLAALLHFPAAGGLATGR